MDPDIYISLSLSQIPRESVLSVYSSSRLHFAFLQKVYLYPPSHLSFSKVPESHSSFFPRGEYIYTIDQNADARWEEVPRTEKNEFDAV